MSVLRFNRSISNKEFKARVVPSLRWFKVRLVVRGKKQIAIVLSRLIIG